MNAKEWRADRNRRIAEMKLRLLSMPEPSKKEKQKAEDFGKLIVKAKLHRDRVGWGLGG